jgi:transposase
MIVIMSPVPAPLPGPVPADPEVVAKPERRVYTAEYKKRILALADAAKEKGDVAKLLRREGLYSSTLAGWRRERESALDKAFSQKRGPEPTSHPLAHENERLRRQNQHLEEELRKAEIIIEIQKKVAMLLGKPLALIPERENS